MAITTRSAKNKGYSFQKKIAEKLREKFPTLDEQDIMSCPSSVNGEDILLSTTAQTLIPYSFECKARKKIAVYEWYDQAKGNSKGREPAVIIKKDRGKPLVIIDLEHFLEIMK